MKIHDKVVEKKVVVMKSKKNIYKKKCVTKTGESSLLHLYYERFKGSKEIE